MRKLPTVALYLLLVLVIQTVAACTAFDDSDDNVAAEQAAESTATASPTVTESPTTVPPTATNAPTATAIPPTPIETQADNSDDGQTSIAVKFTDDSDLPSDLPEVCRNDVVPNIFNDFVASYNAGDLDGVMDIMQKNVPGWEYSDGWELVVSDASEFIEFKWFSMNSSQATGFIVRTPWEIRDHLKFQFAAGAQLRLDKISVGPATAQSRPESGMEPENGAWTSKRNANFGLEFERLVGGQQWSRGSAMCLVDCETSKIIMWNSSAMLSSDVQFPPPSPTATVIPSQDPSEQVKVEFNDESVVPEVCYGGVVRHVIEDFVRFYNAGDIDGILSLIQEDVPGWKWSDSWTPAAMDESGMVEFKFISMNANQESGFIARTIEELREYLAARFRAGEQIRINSIDVAASTVVFVDGTTGPYTSERNASIGIDLERLVDGAAGQQWWQPAVGVGTVDCVTGKIILWSTG